MTGAQAAGIRIVEARPTPKVGPRQLVPALVGVGLLAGLVTWIGPAVLWRQVVALRWVLPVLIVFGLIKHLLRTLGWNVALKAEGVKITLPHLLRVRIAAQGMAHLSGLDLLVSEPLKPWLLRNVATVQQTIPSTLVEASIYWVTSLLVTTVGTFVALTVVIDSADALAIALVSLATLGGVVLLVFARTPLLPRLAELVGRRVAIQPKWSALLAKAGEIETQMRSFRLRHPATVASLLGFNLLVQVVMFTEVWLVLSTVGAAPDFFRLVTIEAASRIVKMMSFYLPARLGADEAGAAGSFALLGLNPAAGVALALARRIQALTWATVGLVWLGRAGVPRRPVGSSLTVARQSPNGEVRSAQAEKRAS